MMYNRERPCGRDQRSQLVYLGADKRAVKGARMPVFILSGQGD